jgi:hypothetical protein
MGLQHQIQEIAMKIYVIPNLQHKFRIPGLKTYEKPLEIWQAPQ